MLDKEFEKEIELRKMLRKKVSRGEKLTPEEKMWQETHKEFSQLYGAPLLKKDVIRIEKDKLYRFHISFIKATHSLMITPCFKVTGLKGYINTETDITNFTGKKSKNQSVQMLVPYINEVKRDFYFSYQSELGLISVYFSCEYDDDYQHLRIRRGSDSWEGLYMIRTDVNDNSVIYQCRAEGAAEFESLVFLVEWEKLSG